MIFYVQKDSISQFISIFLQKNTLQTGRYHLIALTIVIVWGTTFISTKLLLAVGLEPDSIFFYRFLMAYLGIWLFGKTHALYSNNWKDEGLFILIGLTGGSLYFLAENYALQYTQASNVALIVCTAPLLTALLSHFFANEKLNRNMLLGSLMALLGVSLVIFNGQYILKISPAGDILSLSATVCWAVYTILLKRISNRYTTLFITRKVFFYGLLTILPFFLFKPFGNHFALFARPVVWGNLLFLGIGASLLCYFFWNLAVKKLGAVRTTNYVYVVPVVTLIASSIILHEKITGVAIIGALLILAGIVWAGQKN